VQRLSLGAATAVLIAACLNAAACYEATSLRVSARSPAPVADCVQAADDVFKAGWYQRVVHTYGPDLFYSPRMTLGSSARPAVGWGIGVWIKAKDGPPGEPEVCEYELESLQPGPMCGATQCVYAPQRGAEFDEALKDFARRLGAAPPVAAR
jgi:hypothetical protein